ncbi:MAG TPA: pyruvate kinase [Ilumatobacteraceae bacterium]|nr:pyruvate kinase [Ilumatobacteraceae bacterium]
MRKIGDQSDLEVLEIEMLELHNALLAAEALRAEEIAATHSSHRLSAANLVHYVELRNHDVRDLQSHLAALGLSSLGRSEPCVLATVEAVLGVLARLTGHVSPDSHAGIGLVEGHELLSRNADELLGPLPPGRSTRIMVTMPSEAADDENLIDAFVENGMDVARVNCAHDDSRAWTRMIAKLETSMTADGRRCPVAMDLGGPKLRTGPLQPGPRAMRIGPRRDDTGHVMTPAKVWLTAGGRSSRALGVDSSISELSVADEEWLSRRRPGDLIMLRDSRGARRKWRIIEVGQRGCLVSTEQTTYVTSGLKLTCPRDSVEDSVVISELPPVEQAHHVHRGDRVVLTRSLDPASATLPGAVHYIGCSLPEAFDQAQVGERVWLDDGKIGGTIGRVAETEIEFFVTDVRPGGAKLKAGKGINLPDTDLRLAALTPKDLEDLTFVARHADVVNLSFVRQSEDVEQLQHELTRLDAGGVGIVLKIENVAAFANLPELLLTAMRSRHVGVMIARGDLAIEVGFERLAEVQEEIMWACEAAHVPVIWATQVLDTLARTGQPSRAEVTDAAMAQRAECVMLNKGPYIVDAIRALDSIFTRMQHHQSKKRSLLRRLRAWDHTARPSEFTSTSS